MRTPRDVPLLIVRAHADPFVARLHLERSKGDFVAWTGKRVSITRRGPLSRTFSAGVGVRAFELSARFVNLWLDDAPVAVGADAVAELYAAAPGDVALDLPTVDAVVAERLAVGADGQQPSKLFEK
jgi:hypothetical protein